MPFPVDIQFIQETEKELDVFFPPMFKAKMIQLNGGEVVTKDQSNDDEHWTLYPFFDKSTKERIRRTCNHIGDATKIAREEWGDNFPANAIVIGHNESGDELILLPAESVLPKFLSETIYAWRHEVDEIGINSVEFMAANINEILDKHLLLLDHR